MGRQPQRTISQIAEKARVHGAGSLTPAEFAALKRLQKSSQPEGEIKNQLALGRMLGVTQPAVAQMLAWEDWPVARRAAPWSAAEGQTIVDWFKARQADDEGDPTVRARIDLAKLEKLNIEIATSKGKLVDRGLLDIAALALTQIFIQQLNDLEQALPLQVQGLNAGQIERIVSERIRTMRQRLSDTLKIELAKVIVAIGGRTGISSSDLDMNSRGEPLPPAPPFNETKRGWRKPAPTGKGDEKSSG